VHYEYPNIPPASYLLSLLQNKEKLNDWEFYQAYKQGVYVFPKKTSFPLTFVNHPPLSAYYYEVRFVNYNNPLGWDNGTPYKAVILWHYLSNWAYNIRSGSDNYVENGIINNDNTWTSLGNQGNRDGSFYSIDTEGETFDYLGNKVGTYTIDNSVYPPIVIIPPISSGSTTTTTTPINPSTTSSSGTRNNIPTRSGGSEAVIITDNTGSGISISDINQQGWVEKIDSQNISGWAAKGKNPTAVDIYIDDVKHTITPSLARPDVANMLNTTNQNFGWSFDIPQTSINTSKGKHQFAVYFAGSKMQLSSNLPPFYAVIDPIIVPITPTTEPPKTDIPITPKQPNLKPIIIGLGIVILGLITYKILKKK
jgi:hypothetical protein